jgi:hypothetical protein
MGGWLAFAQAFATRCYTLLQTQCSKFATLVLLRRGSNLCMAQGFLQFGRGFLLEDVFVPLCASKAQNRKPHLSAILPCLVPIDAQCCRLHVDTTLVSIGCLCAQHVSKACFTGVPNSDQVYRAHVALVPSDRPYNYKNIGMNWQQCATGEIRLGSEGVADSLVRCSRSLSIAQTLRIAPDICIPLTVNAGRIFQDEIPREAEDVATEASRCSGRDMSVGRPSSQRCRTA